ncbi:MAG: hypothetical protein JNM17_34870 [Archangium sp.]|nr:hypothetical protein [Archangium sp.]
MKACPQCGRQASDAAKWCVACRFSWETKPAPANEAICPVCRGPAGIGSLAVRKIGETTRYGIPLVLSVSVTPYENGAFRGLCSRCAFRIERGRWLAFFLSLLPMIAVFILAGIKESPLLGTIGGILGILALRGLFYSWVDAFIWGQGVINQLQLPPGETYTFPSSILSVLMRALIAPLAVVFIGASIALMVLSALKH